MAMTNLFADSFNHKLRGAYTNPPLSGLIWCFSPLVAWRASARLRFAGQKSHKSFSLRGALQF